MASKARIRQNKLLGILKDQRTGVTSITNQVLSGMLGVSERTIRRDLVALREHDLIKVDVKVLHKIYPTKQRDIIVPHEPQHRWTIDQERQLADINNHDVKWDGYEWTWLRRIDGEWERNMPNKTFNSREQIWSWIYGACSNHYKKCSNGNRYVNRNE